MMSTKKKKESIYKIGSSIAQHRRKEKDEFVTNTAVARALCERKSSIDPKLDGVNVYWLVNKEYNNLSNKARKPLAGDGISVYKNTKMGGVLSTFTSGTHPYTVSNLVNHRKGVVNEMEITIFNHSKYDSYVGSVKDVEVVIDGQSYRYQTIAELLHEESNIVSQITELKRAQEEKRKALEAAEKAAEEERQREAEEKAEKARLQAEEIRRKAEEEQKQINELENKLVESQEKKARALAFIREGMQMRVQHILDASQENAKRSHLYDGVPVVIEGGPGTGKTTTMIQRLKFLISEIALREYEAPLTDAQIEEVTNPQNRNKKWLYFSPTDKLLGYLRDNMTAEELVADEDNSTTLEAFSKKMLGAYGLKIPGTEGPFKWYKNKEGEESMITDATVAIAAFERFLVKKISSSMMAAAKMATSDYSWHASALGIKAYCQKAENIKDIIGLMNLLNSMQQNEEAVIKANDKQVNEFKSKKANLVLNNVLADEQMTLGVKKLFAKWSDDEENVDEELDDEDIEESEVFDNLLQDFKPMLYSNLKSLVYKIALRSIDKKQKLSQKHSELYKIVRPYVDAQDLLELGQLAWFSKIFAKPCKGICVNIFNQIPKLYKEFRKDLVKQGSTCYNQKLLQKVIQKDNGKQIHQDEVELLVGFINNLILKVYKKSKARFESIRNHKYVAAYMENVKPVIGVDEATDYSMIDYYFMASFRHYEYNSMTLCGDIMQGLNDNGITSWEELRQKLLPDLQVYELNVSYRQTPTLLAMSKELYQDDQGKPAPYHTTFEKSDSEAAPLCYISDDMEKKTRWMAKRICEVHTRYGGKLPSVAILVGDDVDIPEMIETMEEQDILNGIGIYDCSDGRNPNQTKCVRIFRLSEVKGMEFEVVFFYDIDEALSGQSHKMMQRYLYVGVSRATSHLAATFMQAEGNEDVIKYFDTSKKNWK